MPDRCFYTMTPSGHRAAYASYCGQWFVEWPIGGLAAVRFAPHDSHSLASDVYPATFERRVDRCIQILAGVIEAPAPNTFKCAFPGRKAGGNWIARHRVKGFGGAHSGRHLYNMMGGNVTEVDYFFMEKLNSNVPIEQDTTVVQLPSTESADSSVTLYIPAKESEILDCALDFSPWTPLSWSAHRGLRDVLVAFAKERMDLHRDTLATTLRSAVANWPERLDARGWNPRFVRENMADMAASAVLAGSGNSGDVVRIVTDIALLWWEHSGRIADLDATTFWRTPGSWTKSSSLESMAVIALVKCFVMEWSNELDYQMYHDLPMELFLG